MNDSTQKAQIAALVTALLALGVAPRAHADEGYLPPNSPACTDQVRSDRGAFIYGNFTSEDPPTRRLFYSETPDGEAVELPPGEPPPEGVFYFRACVTSTASAPAGYRFLVLPNADATDVAFDIGSHTAELESQGKACGGFGQNQERRFGESSVAILWTVNTFDGDLNPLGETSAVTTDSVNDVITLTGDAQFFSICASNTSDERAILDFDVL